MAKQTRKIDLLAVPKQDLELKVRPRPTRPRKCEECGVNPADIPSRLCVGCDAYREHTGWF